MPILRIARHGETTWNAQGRYQGRLDVPLSPLGRAQARALAEALSDKDIGAIISSPLLRCVETAMPLAELIGVTVQTDPLLTEIAHGTWQGRYRDEIARSEPELYRAWREHPEAVRFEGGESLRDVEVRWQRFVTGFEPHSNTLIVTHDIVARIALLERTGRSIQTLRDVRSLNGAYAEFAVERDRWRLLAESVSSHLKDLEADHERQAL